MEKGIYLDYLALRVCTKIKEIRLKQNEVRNLPNHIYNANFFGHSLKGQNEKRGFGSS
jgi:hypothetical protein